MIAALYVQTGGCYFGLPDVDPWDEARDARLYDGPHPVVAHPPCQRWGRYWSGGPSAKVRRILGDDGGCFAAALAAVRKWGGVLEHPEGSHAWRHFGLNVPPHTGGWIVADFDGGWTCCVEQGAYGHRARKKTWLYASGVELSSLKWGSAEGEFHGLELSFRSAEDRRQYRETGILPAYVAGKLKGGKFPRISGRELAATPIPFRDLLLDMARSVTIQARAA